VTVPTVIVIPANHTVLLTASGGGSGTIAEDDEPDELAPAEDVPPPAGGPSPLPPVELLQADTTAAQTAAAPIKPSDVRFVRSRLIANPPGW